MHQGSVNSQVLPSPDKPRLCSKPSAGHRVLALCFMKAGLQLALLS